MAESNHPRFRVLAVTASQGRFGYLIYDAQQHRYDGLYYDYQYSQNIADFYNTTGGYAFPDPPLDPKSMAVVLPSTP